MFAICTDLEGVWVPEVWINVSKKTGIEELKMTTRDINDYNVLMKHRIKILKEHKLTIKDIQKVIATIRPLEGSLELLNLLRSQILTVIVSDTFEEFAEPLMAQLGQPALFCNNLVIGPDGMIENYNLRQPDQKRCVAEALKSLKYTVIGIGDSYNDISMLKNANHGILFKPPQNVINDHPDLPVVQSYDELKNRILQITR
jgi:phosphoserine / homoserine phosphotransferase